MKKFNHLTTMNPKYFLYYECLITRIQFYIFNYIKNICIEEICYLFKIFTCKWELNPSYKNIYEFELSPFRIRVFITETFWPEIRKNRKNKITRNYK